MPRCTRSSSKLSLTPTEFGVPEWAQPLNVPVFTLTYRTGVSARFGSGKQGSASESRMLNATYSTSAFACLNQTN